MRKAILITLILAIIFVNSCYKTSINPPALQESPRIVEHIDIIQEERIESPPILIQKDYSSFYLSKSNFIYTAGVPIERIIIILKFINPKYFEGVAKIEFIKTNKIWSNSKDGWYYSGSRSIRIFDGDESDEFLTRVVLHELKHHWCYINFNNVEINHQGCFLNTPIDNEYGIIK